MLTAIALAIGFGALALGATWLVDGASSLARRLGVSRLVVGLTVVALGTSLPELVANLTAALQGSTDLAIGNVLGSNIANVLLILGLCALVRPLPLEQHTTWLHVPYSLLAVIVLAGTAADGLLDGSAFSVISRSDGLTLLGFCAVFIYGTVISSRGRKLPPDVSAEDVAMRSVWDTTWRTAAGLALLVGGGYATVFGAVNAAHALGLSEATIGLTVVAVGTSLPELVTSVVAARRGEGGIAVGNVVGSNILNVFFILGGTAAVAPLPVNPHLWLDFGVAGLASLVLFLTAFTGQRYTIDRGWGLAFIGCYVAYVATILFNQ